jgi:CDP-diacylglycerol--serine O-phosphatidyltransferase
VGVIRIPILPTLVTLGNGFCGFAAISFVIHAGAHPMNFEADMKFAGWLIMLAMVFDALDGRVARMTNSTSRFGIELDSLCDVISFGVAPGVIIKTIAHQQRFYPNVAWVTGALFMLCAALRLARFNVETDQEESSHQGFTGLPSPAAGGFIASLAVLYYSLRAEEAEFGRVATVLAPFMDGLLWSVPFVGVGIALLMISNVPYPHFLNRLMRDYGPFEHLVAIILVILFAVLTRPFSLPLAFGLYAGSGIVLALKRMVMASAVGLKTGPR